MNDQIRVVIAGPPMPKERARRGKGGRFYTPEKTLAYEETVGWQLLAARCQQVPHWSMDRSYDVDIIAAVPDLTHRDEDNIKKSIYDAANGVLWRDDAQIVLSRFQKLLSPEQPRVEILVRMLDSAFNAKVKSSRARVNGHAFGAAEKAVMRRLPTGGK